VWADHEIGIRPREVKRFVHPEVGALELASGLRTFSYETWPLTRIHQFDLSRGVTGFGAG
jgi:hypothetical protein